MYAQQRKAIKLLGNEWVSQDEIEGDIGEEFEEEKCCEIRKKDCECFEREEEEKEERFRQPELQSKQYKRYQKVMDGFVEDSIDKEE